MYAEWGTGTQAEAKTNSDTNVGVDSRVVAGETNNGDDCDYVSVITAGTTRAITEVGFFDASTVGNLVTYTTFTVINLSSGAGIEFTLNLEIA